MISNLGPKQIAVLQRLSQAGGEMRHGGNLGTKEMMASLKTRSLVTSRMVVEERPQNDSRYAPVRSVTVWRLTSEGREALAEAGAQP